MLDDPKRAEQSRWMNERFFCGAKDDSAQHGSTASFPGLNSIFFSAVCSCVHSEFMVVCCL